jgi:glucose/arabinose dehydrogenase
VVPSADGQRLYVTVGSGCNVGEAGMAQEKGRAAILEVDIATKRARIFAAGMRSPNGMAFEPHSGKLWTVVNERDMLGSDLVPDYLASVSAGDHFGWPWYYWGSHRDTRVQHDVRLGPDWTSGAFTGLHGS